MTYYLDNDIYSNNAKFDSTRAGFGRGLKKAADEDERIIGLCADLADSLKMTEFINAYPDRYIEVGIAEQNLVTVASGLALAGKIPFAASYAAFSPGRNWEQIKTTAALNDMPVKIVGGHSGSTVGPDGATHQMFEDIALMRVMPNMVVVSPGDAIEAQKATIAIAKNNKPSYLRLARESTPVFSTDKSPFEIGKAYVLKDGRDVTIFSTGIETAFALKSAKTLAEKGIDAEVVHVPTIKPLDIETIINSVKKTGRAVTCEDAQAAAGFGGVIAETLCDYMPAPMLRIGVEDRYGEAGEPMEVHQKLGLADDNITAKVIKFVNSRPQYRAGF